MFCYLYTLPMTRTTDAESKKENSTKIKSLAISLPPLGILKIIIFLAFITDLPYVLYDTSYSTKLLYNLFIIKAYDY